MLKGDTSKMLEELRKENQTLQLQRKYEEGSLQEEELSISQKEELLALYQKQIANLEKIGRASCRERVSKSV